MTLPAKIRLHFSLLITTQSNELRVYVGINIFNDLRWDVHVDALCARVESRLYFLNLLKRYGLSTDDFS